MKLGAKNYRQEIVALKLDSYKQWHYFRNRPRPPITPPRPRFFVAEWVFRFS